MTYVLWGIWIPFIGTAAGAACVLLLKGQLHSQWRRAFTGFAAGVMVAASIWSLIMPAFDLSKAWGKWSFFPVVSGFWIGILFLLLLDHLIPHLHWRAQEAEGPKVRLSRTTKMLLAVTIHNIPEGMAVGVVYAGALAAGEGSAVAGTWALVIGIAIQNFPEGAIVSMPLHAEGYSKKRAFVYGVLSGIVEPLAALLMILLASFLLPTMPYLLSFAAGAMIYVVVEELIPEMATGEHSDIGVLCFAAGFSVMMVLDVVLG